MNFHAFRKNAIVHGRQLWMGSEGGLAQVQRRRGGTQKVCGVCTVSWMETEWTKKANEVKRNQDNLFNELLNL